MRKEAGNAGQFVVHYPMIGGKTEWPRFRALGSRPGSVPVGAMFWLILSLSIIDRICLLVRFGFVFTDSDQVLFWMGGRDYSHGIFHEPCVYGQNYLYMLESLLAAPFLRLGIPPWHVFPVVTSVLALAPYVAFAFYYRRRDLPAACVFAAIPVLLPTEFGVMTTATHGIVTGLCMVSFFPVIYSLKCCRVRFLFAGFAAGLAFLMNPNSLPVLVVLVLSMQLREARSWRPWLYPVIGAAPFMAAGSLVAIFYAKHTPMHTLSPAMLIFHPEIFAGGIKHLDRHFLWLCPVIWPHGSFVLALLIIIIAILAAKRRLAGTVALLAAGAILLYSLGLPKVEDGTNCAIFAWSRMYLAVPLLLGIAFSFCSDLIRRAGEFSFRLLLVSVVVFAVKMSTMGAAIDRQENAPLELLKLRRVEDVKQACGRIEALCRGGVDLVVALPPINCTYFDASFYCYGPEMMYPDYPRTLVYGFERRSCRAEMEATNVCSNILFIGGSRQGWQRIAGPDITDCGDDKTVLHLVHNSAALTLPDLLRKLKPVTR